MVPFLWTVAGERGECPAMHHRCSPALVASWLALLVAVPLRAADQPQWGQAWSRNMVSAERGLPDSFDLKTGRNIKWKVALGTETHSTPVIANGRIYIGTNNGEPRDAKHRAASPRSRIRDCLRRSG